MASGGHLLQQQKTNVENQIKNLRNEDLKDICRAFKEQVSGTKALLQARCTKVLNEIVNRGDVTAFEELKRVGGIQGLPSLTKNNAASSSSAHQSSYQQQYNMPSHRGGGVGLTQNRLPTGGKYFKPSPFYDVLETLLPLQDLPEMPQNRHTVKSNLLLKPEIAQQFRGPDSASFKILMYCGLSHTMTAYSQVDVTFPNQIEVKVNDQDVKHNFKGLKNKAGSTKPADITSFVRKFGGQDNLIQITYALTTKRFAYTVYLVRSISTDKLIERIKKGNIIPKDKVLRDMNKANSDPDIAATSIRMSLKDPVSTMRITLPVRSSHCTHNQCFDGAMFLSLQEQAPQWSCPVCSKSVSFESLCVDKYFEDILNRTSKAIEKVDIEPNGDWKVIKEDDDTQPNGTSSKVRASYDDDFDDLVELDQPMSRPVNGLKRDSFPPTLSPFPGQAFSFNTPPLSSREPSVAQSATSTQRSSNKRPQSAVIDLTLSDDDEDDEPPRPAKRQSTMQSQNSTSRTTSYSTPTSLPDLRYPPHQQQQQSYSSNRSGAQTDTYRSLSNNNNSHSNNYSTSSTTTTNNNTFNPPPSSISPPNPTSPFGQRSPVSWSLGQQQQSRPSSSLQQQQRQPSQQQSMFPPPTSNLNTSPFRAGGLFGSPSSTSTTGQQPSALRLPPLQSTTTQQQGLNTSTSSAGLYRDWRSDFDYGRFDGSPG